VTLLLGPVRLQGGGLQKGGASTWPLGTEFVMMSQKRSLGHMEVETKKVYQ
jgi:hypothetical protein